MSVVDLLLMVLLVGITTLVVLIPWILLFETWRKPNEYIDAGLGVPICVLLCIFEIASVIDWLSGHISKLM